MDFLKKRMGLGSMGEKEEVRKSELKSFLVVRERKGKGRVSVRVV